MPEKNHRNCIWGIDCGEGSPCANCSDFSPINEEADDEAFYKSDLEMRKEAYAETEDQFGRRK